MHGSKDPLKTFENRLSISCHFRLSKLFRIHATELTTLSVEVGDKEIACNLN
jgi:hypothetical protein